MVWRPALLALTLAGCASAQAERVPGYHLVSGKFEPGRGPDGNSVFIDAPDGLILVDTGRHPAHRDKLLAYAKERGRPIAAIVNTHWHLDHTTGNGELRAAYPAARLHASTAIEGALEGFLKRSRANVEAYVNSGKATPQQLAEIRRGWAALDNPDGFRATDPVTRSARMRIAGRAMNVNLAPFAVTEGDVWLHLPDERLVIAGDLVVGLMPFMDTACADGWRKALDSVAATDFDTLIPGHGSPMTKPQFLEWRSAFNNLLDCAAGDADRQTCIAGWRRDAAAFIPAGDEARVDEMTGYYIDTRLRAEPAERARYCPGGTG